MMKRRTISMYGFLMALFMALVTGHAASEEVSPSTVQAIRLVVQSQLEALAQDDAEKAYSLTTSSTQQLVGSPNGLLTLIKKEFTPIYRPRHAQFEETEIVNGRGLQVVQLIDRSGVIWIAIYQVEQEKDGQWKVDGCQLFETDQKFI